MTSPTAIFFESCEMMKKTDEKGRGPDPLQYRLHAGLFQMSAILEEILSKLNDLESRLK